MITIVNLSPPIWYWLFSSLSNVFKFLPFKTLKDPLPLSHSESMWLSPHLHLPLLLETTLWCWWHCLKCVWMVMWGWSMATVLCKDGCRCVSVVPLGLCVILMDGHRVKRTWCADSSVISLYLVSCLIMHSPILHGNISWCNSDPAVYSPPWQNKNWSWT